MIPISLTLPMGVMVNNNQGQGSNLKWGIQSDASLFCMDCMGFGGFFGYLTPWGGIPSVRFMGVLVGFLVI
jgi:hypothetical protein